LAAALGLLLPALYLLGYLIPEKSYAWAAHIGVAGKPYFASALHTAGSCGIILAIMGNGAIFKRLDGSFFRLLGRLSFPLYLVHILVLCSVSSLVYVRLCAAGIGMAVTLPATFAVTLLVSLAMSWPLMKADEWWTGVVNRWARRVVLGAPGAAAVMPATS
jgi:peptidoglycan/LPS O-acetylase OafA/YrhL